MRVLVVGATGGSGRAVVAELLARGHEVTAFGRRPEALRTLPEPAATIAGDATVPADLERAVRGQDAVVVALGISEPALRVRLLGSRGTPGDVRSRGTQEVIAAMRRHGVRRLVVQTSYGVGPTRQRLPWAQRLVFKLLLAPQIADTEVQEREVRASGLDWVLVQPVTLTDEVDDGRPVVSSRGETVSMKVSRVRVARVLADAVESDAHVGRTLAVSGIAPPVSTPAASASTAPQDG